MGAHPQGVDIALEKGVSRQSFKERVLDVPPQPCITKDNVSIINVARGRAEALVLKKDAESKAVVINAEARSRAVVIDAEAAAQQQKLLAEAPGQAATLAAVFRKHPAVVEALRLLLAKHWMTMGEQLAQAQSGSVLMVAPQSPGSLLVALEDLQK